MITQTGGGVLPFEGPVNEPATVTVQGQPSLVDAADGYAGVALVSMGTPVVAVTATNGRGNTPGPSEKGKQWGWPKDRGQPEPKPKDRRCG